MLEEKIKKVLCEALKIKEGAYHEDLAIGDIPEWDSLGHANLLQAVEREFNIALDVGDAIGIETAGDLVTTVRQYIGGTGSS